MKYFPRVLLPVLLFLLTAFPAFALEVPALRGYVNDYGGMLSPEAARGLEGELAAFEREESTQIVVLTVPSLEGGQIEEFSIRVAEAWKIGHKGIDNGALLILARDERKIRVEVGRGLEGKLTDLVSGRIIRERMTPLLRAGQVDAGIVAGVRGIEQAVKGEYRGEAGKVRHGKKSAPPIFTFLIFLLVVCVFFGAVSRFLGGVAGAVGLPLVAFLNYPGLGLVLLAILGGVGFVVGLVIAFLFGSGGGFGGPFIGGGFGGFGGGYGGRDSGGFSGGGGDFGGGGASGEW